MREIKFRAWDLSHREMIYISDFYWFEENGVRDVHGEGIAGRYVILQFTGLKDKNGRDIYEGDIVQFHGYIIKWEKGQEMKVPVDTNMEVEWSLDICGEYGCVGWNLSSFDASEVEIIGNIYEHPELMEVK